MPEELARFELGDGGGAVYVAFEDQDPQIVRARGRDRSRNGAVDVAAGRFEEGLDQIRQMAGRTLERMVSLPSPPSTVELEFGVKFNVETGVVIARTGVEGHLKVKVVWERGERSRAPEEDEGSPAAPAAQEVPARPGPAPDGPPATVPAQAVGQSDAQAGADGEG
ncbi:CU044_2847 family protein [Streptomyces sp. NPDC005828]|uniref:CU044_2847 family protein n=1 Tax=Streptomyces sp. NPDC005828 TaxID=3157071 RepID=UPI0033E37742